MRLIRRVERGRRLFRVLHGGEGTLSMGFGLSLKHNDEGLLQSGGVELDGVPTTLW